MNSQNPCGGSSNTGKNESFPNARSSRTQTRWGGTCPLCQVIEGRECPKSARPCKKMSARRAQEVAGSRNERPPIFLCGSRMELKSPSKIHGCIQLAKSAPQLRALQ